ncbi:hypothetical protein HCX50_17065 [Microbacterium oxydans]|uniref:hypothetical protein n=1 Tax=Microbacterium sp. B19(2022) TaxID=2914045 RepID=UPI00142FC1CB|nr:hypothetical protein [Microbacterium sp. B19(2022)]NJI61139.1 hypothetical protein [Microbacterium sp. B19(2022)]
MSKTTAASVESALPAALNGFKEQAAQVKEAHRASRQSIQDDPMMSDLGKRGKLDMLKIETRAKLDGIKAEQEAFVKNLRAQVEKEFRGNQPADADSVLLRRDAADRARKIIDHREAMEVLQDAIANGDASMAHAIGIRARNSVWEAVAEAYQAAHPQTADAATALSYVEANTSGAAYNMANNITFSDPNV